ncbi:hypothetical protein CORC01_12690, partial [Colletotrichum orchidophilum]
SPPTLSRFPPLPVSFIHCSTSATPSSYILIQPTPGYHRSFFFPLPKVLFILQAFAAVLVAESSSTPLFQRPLMLASPSIATLRHRTSWQRQTPERRRSNQPVAIHPSSHGLDSRVPPTLRGQLLVP